MNMLEVGGADIHDEAISNILVLQGTAPNHQKLGVCFLHNVRQVRLVGAADFAVRARSRWWAGEGDECGVEREGV